MARPVYSRLLGRGHLVLPHINFIFYTPPPGFIAILRDVDVKGAVSGPGVFQIYDAVSNVVIVEFDTPSSHGSDFIRQWQGRQVVPFGVNLAIATNAGAGSIDYSVSGYELASP